MENTVLSFYAANNLIEEVINGKGEYVYESCPVKGGCSYVHWDYVRDEDGNVLVDEHGYDKKEKVPGCILGHLFHKLGLSLDDLEEIGSLASNRDHFEALGLRFTDKTFFFLDALQAFQDDGVAWGKARSLAYAIVMRQSWNRETEDFVMVGVN